MKKLISINIPCYNERDNVIPLCQAIINIFETELTDYNYKIQFIDNASNDGTRENIKKLCQENPNVCAIFNIKNFGFNSGFYGFLQTKGSCTINMAADFQDPVELIPKLVHEWENGAKIVCAVKTKSKESKLVFFARTLYYKLLDKFSEYQIIENFSSYGLYDHSFLEILRKLDEPCPYLRGLVAEFGYKISKITYVQPKRKSGKSKNNFFSLFNLALKSFINYTKVLPKASIVLGCVGILISVALMILSLLLRISADIKFVILLGMLLFIGSLQMFFIGILCEYVLNITERVKRRPLVIEEMRINMGDEDVD